MKNNFKLLIKSVIAVMGASVLASCVSDAWKDHYSYKSDSNEPVSSLAKTIESLSKQGNQDAQYFMETLQNTFMYRDDSILTLTYWDLLNDDQFLTVWLPSNVQNWDEYRSDDLENKDHKKVGNEFILNHIARFSHSVGTSTHERVKMMSNKSFRSNSDNMNGVDYLADGKNIRCTNGLLHKLNGQIPYSPTIYDFLTGTVSYPSQNGQLYDYSKKFGEWFGSFTVEEIDEERSVKGEINMETGEVEWIDKVIIRSSELMKKYGYINVEDSDYALVLPRPELWDSVFDTVKYYYTYSDNLEGRDSIQKYWTRSAMLTDVFFNMNIQKHPQDSITTTQFKQSERMSETYPYHVYYRPYDAGGLFNAGSCVDSVICSNGIVYIKNFWPYSDRAFRRTIKIEAEDYTFSGNIMKSSLVSFSPANAAISKPAKAIQLQMRDDAYIVEFKVPDNLKGKYNLKVVIFPNRDKKKPTLVHPLICYSRQTSQGWTKDTLYHKNYWHEGRQAYVDLNDTIGKAYFNKNAEWEYTPDTLVMGPFDLKESNYKTNDPRLLVWIKSKVDKTNNTKYDKEMWLDCIMLEPVFE